MLHFVDRADSFDDSLSLFRTVVASFSFDPGYGPVSYWWRLVALAGGIAGLIWLGIRLQTRYSTEA